MRYELDGIISDTHTDLVDVTTVGDGPENAEYVLGRASITVHSGYGSIELPWDAPPMLKVGHPVRLIVEVEGGTDE
jgi:hypothetical protein